MMATCVLVYWCQIDRQLLPLRRPQHFDPGGAQLHPWILGKQVQSESETVRISHNTGFVFV